MAIMRSAVFTMIGIVAIGWALASMAPAHWVLGELFLLAAFILVVHEVLREYLLVRNQGLQVRSTGNSAVAGGTEGGRGGAWFSEAQSDDHDAQPDVFHPWDFGQATAKPRVTVAGSVSSTRIVYSSHQSVEQIAHEMLMQAFRQASRQHHPDHGGDPEDMRRVCAARDMILRAIHKP